MSAEHPAPWRWDPYGPVLYDGNGGEVLVYDVEESDAPTDAAKALIAAAPEMEQALREASAAVAELLRYGVLTGGQCGQLIGQPCTWSEPCMFHRVAALVNIPVLARIDEARHG